MTDAADNTANRPAGRLRDYVILMRPHQWIKNVVIFAGPAAGLKLLTPAALVQAVLAFAAFCMAASATYAINDVIDRHTDADHPTKRHRPLVRGTVSPASAVMFGIALMVGALGLTSLMTHRWVTVVVGTYFIMTLAYSLVLKQQIILDVIVIATGFVLRAWAGSLAVGVGTSVWLVACVFTLCLFMGFGKRRCELATLGKSGNADDAGRHRPTLIRYTPDLLNHLITVSAGITVMTFLIYTMDTTHNPSPFHKEHLFFTLPLVVYGIFRFAMVSEMGLYSGPTEIVLKDRGLLAAIILWTLAALTIAYQEILLGPGGLEAWFGYP